MPEIPAEQRVGKYTVVTTPGMGSAVTKRGFLVRECVKDFHTGDMQRDYDNAIQWAKDNQ